MTQLRKRRARLTFGAFTIDSDGGLDFTFDVSSDLTKKPNTATIKIFNLSESKRSEFEGMEDRIASLWVGYEGQDLLEIFRGDISIGNNTLTDQGDTVCTLSIADGEKAIRGARTNRSFRRNTSFVEIARTVAGDLLSSGGNIDQAMRTIEGTLAGGRTSSAEHGTVVSGSAADELDRLMRSHNLEWSIQGGALQALRRGEGLNPPVILSSDSGMIGSPELQTEKKKGKAKRTILVRSLINAELFPGRLVDIRGKFLQATGRIERAKYTGDTFTEAWYADLEVSLRG